MQRTLSRLSVSFLLFVGILLTWNSHLQAASREGSLVATVDQEKITTAEMEKALKQQLYQLDVQRYQEEKAWVDNRVNEILDNQEALHRHMSVKDLEEQEITQKAGKATDEELRKFYDDHKSSFRKNAAGDLQTFDEAKGKIADYLNQQRVEDRRAAFFEELRKKANVVINLQRPEAPIIPVTYGAQDPVLGPADAPVTILEFTDYQCPFCTRAEVTLQQVLKKYPTQVKIVTRNFPLPFHEHARPAANAALCAQEQHMYAPYRAKLFNGAALDDQSLVNLAGTLGMDKAKFKACFDSRKYDAQIEKDIADAQKWGVSGTPGFFINGRFLNGAQPLSSFEDLIQQALSNKK